MAHAVFPANQGQLTLIDYTSTATSQVVTLSGLDGDATGYLQCNFLFKCANADGTTAQLTINGATTGLETVVWVSTFGGTAVAATTSMTAPILQPYDNGVCHGSLKIWGKSGVYRRLLMEFFETPASDAAIYRRYSFGGRWKNTANNITSIGFSATAPGDINTGSRFVVTTAVGSYPI
jgi:hypothetical protein